MNQNDRPDLPDSGESAQNSFLDLAPSPHHQLHHCTQITVKMTFDSATVMIQLGVN